MKMKKNEKDRRIEESERCLGIKPGLSSKEENFELVVVSRKKERRENEKKKGRKRWDI